MTLFDNRCFETVEVDAVDQVVTDFVDKHVEKNIVTLMDETFLHYDPLGVVLIMGAWNYPIMLSLGPLGIRKCVYSASFQTSYLRFCSFCTCSFVLSICNLTGEIHVNPRINHHPINEFYV